MRHGLIIGKFYPPHEGHHFLIETALSECDSVTVLILANDSETIPAVIRADLIERSHPGWFHAGRLRVEYARCNLPVDYNSRDADREHAKFIADYYASINRVLPTTLYSSEEYGERLAADLTELNKFDFTTEHRMVDPKRIIKPVSATAIRKNPAAHWEALRGPVRAYLTKRVVICGAESSGTTTLAKALADRYQTIWVPEYGRLFSEAVGLSHRWTSDDFIHIAWEQHKLEDNLAERAGPVTFCDTDGIATAMFHELYMKQPAPQEIREFMYEHHHDLYIVTDHVGVDFEDDGYRLFPHQREWATDWFLNNLQVYSPAPYVVVRGNHQSRMDFATKIVDDLMNWSFGPAGDEL